MKSIFTCIGLLLSLFSLAQNHQDVSGIWQFQIDRNDVGVKEKWFNHTLNDNILLPGSMAQRLKGDMVTAKTKWVSSLYDSTYYYNPYMEKYRKEGNIKFPFFLTPDRHYVGVAWYQQMVEIPKSWKGDHILLYLERAHIETTLWVNGQRVGSENSLCVPHVYDISSFVKPGKCRITLRIDNRLDKVNVGVDSHSVTDQTQGDWNGIVGRMELQHSPMVYLDDVQVYPNLKDKNVKVKLWVKHTDNHLNNTKVQVSLSAESFNSDIIHRVPKINQSLTISNDNEPLTIVLPMGNFQTWDEFHPTLYKMNVNLTANGKTDSRIVEFGMREITINGKWFYVNGRKTMLRGTVENCDFPLTGYAPMNLNEWERVLRICRSYGLNHMRFHSYCPPEAAFRAADRVGFYFQPEGPSWPNHGVALGSGMPIDTYLMDETKAMGRVYGNHASYCMLSCGNEPFGNWVEWVSKFVDYWKATDTRRIYTGASVGGSWQWQPKNQYHVKAGARGLNWSRVMPDSKTDYSARIDTVRQPFVSHETGQWCSFPNFTEIRKYTGLNKARNLEIFRDILTDHNLADRAQDFLMASGKLQSICYKYEIEQILRTPDYAGFQLLSLNDYSGQGTALVGLLDVFFDEKGYMDAPHFRRFCSQTVPLARFDKFVYKNDETFKADLEVAHFDEKPLQQAETTYCLKDKYGKIYAQGSLGCKDITIGKNQALGNISLPLSQFTSPIQLNLEVSIKGTPAINDWNIWVYPAQEKINQGSVYVSDSLDAKALETLQQGGNVLLTAAGHISYGKGIVQYFTPAFWNTSWFKMRPPHTTGIFVNSYHPLFKDFPTESHSDLQWWELVNREQVMLLDDFPDNFQPLIQSIDTWFLSRKIGMLFEAKVLNGKLIMTSIDISTNLDKRIVARQMRKAIFDYMNSDAFRPSEEIDINTIRDLYHKETPKVSVYTNQSPDELIPTIK